MFRVLAASPPYNAQKTKDVIRSRSEVMESVGDPRTSMAALLLLLDKVVPFLPGASLKQLSRKPSPTGFSSPPTAYASSSTGTTNEIAVFSFKARLRFRQNHLVWFVLESARRATMGDERTDRQMGGGEGNEWHNGSHR